MKKRGSLPFLVIFIALAFQAACSNEQVKSIDQKPVHDSAALNRSKTAEAEAMAGNFSQQSQFRFDSMAIPRFLKKYPDFKIFSKDLQTFYRSRNFSYAWYDKNGLIEQAASLHNRFLQIGDQGILSNLAYQNEFHSLMDDTDSSLLREPMNAEAELMLTAQYFNYARNVWQGLGENQTRKLDWFIPRKKLNLQALMDSLLYDSNKEFVAVEPVYRQYGQLKGFLEKYRAIEKKGDWPTIKVGKKSYKPGDSSAVIALIRKRLFAMEDISTDNGSMVFDKDLEEAIRSFQRRHGLREDGVAGRAFMIEMSKPLSEMIEKIIANMERSRWVPANPSGEYLVVNIPAYKLYVYKNDTVLWDMNIVAGQPVHKTTIFNGNMNNIVFSPYWNVPPGILKNEVLPGIRRDPNYLKKHNMEMNGNQVRQKPGPNNSLGKVKFLFPNSYSIYLHDTPAQNLFKEDKRAFSHGCIRLAEPKKLAMYLLRNYPEWTEEKIDAAMNSGKEKYVALKETVPVFIAYFTAWVDRYGKLNIRQDIYDRDDRLTNMLLERK